MIINIEDWKRPRYDSSTTIENDVRSMLSHIVQYGDAEITRLAYQFDATKPSLIKLKPFKDYHLEPELADAIQFAASRIEKFSRFQQTDIQSKSFKDEFGTFGQSVSPIERIGAYIPGGRFPLISTALMTLIPAKVAACPVRIACSPSNNTAILAAASLAGATQFIQIGGVQAIGALTYGYQSIKPVNLIVGPGNSWVNEAKKQVQGQVKIDGLAGPSELLAICDDKQPIKWLALDALSQAEHDPLACSLIISDSPDWLTSVLRYLENDSQYSKLIKNQQIQLIYAKSKAQIITFSEHFAPEHLMLCHNKIKPHDLSNYGSLFIGANSAVALGDYISGPNHTLPTLGNAKHTGGLSVSTFLKILTIQNINENGRQILSKKAMSIAHAEGLTQHFNSLQIRCQSDE